MLTIVGAAPNRTNLYVAACSLIGISGSLDFAAEFAYASSAVWRRIRRFSVFVGAKADDAVPQGRLVAARHFVAQNDARRRR